MLIDKYQITFDKVVDLVNIMFYDMPPQDLNAGPDGLKLSNYEEVLNEVKKVMPKE